MKSVICALLSLLSLCSVAWPQAADPLHWPTRNYISVLQQTALGTGQILLLGDSITEEFWWNQLAGHFVVNAGHGGAGIDDAVATANALLPVVKPHITAVMIGINDCQAAAPTTNYAAWQAKYLGLLQSVVASGSKAVAVTVLPIENGKSLTSTINQTCWWNLNQAVIAAANAAGVPWVNGNLYFGDPNQSPAYWWAFSGYTYDGIHPADYTPGTGGLLAEYNLLNYAVSTYW